MVHIAKLTAMIAAYMTDTIAWKRSNGRDQWGSASAPTVADVAARIIWKNRLIRDAKGREVSSIGSVLVKTKPGMDDTYTIDGVDRPVLSVHERKSFRKVYYEVFLA